MDARERLLDLYDLFSVAIIVVSRQSGKLVFLNQKVYKDMDAPEGSLLGKSYKDVFWPEFHHVYSGLVKQCEQGTEATAVYYWSEKVIWEQITAKLISWDSEDDAIMLNITNITEVAQAQAISEELAYFESVTGLPNGKKLEKDIGELVSFEQVSLLYIQFANFESINDFYGWDVGDKLLLMLKDWFLKTEKRRAHLYKGGQGFVLLGRNTTQEEAIDRMYEIERAFSSPWTVADSETEYLIFCRVKIGAVFGKYVKNEMRSLLLRTMHAEPPGHLPFHIYNEETDKRCKEENQIKSMLTRAVYNKMDGFSVHFHPIVETRSAQWVGLEALCRWAAPNGTLIPPRQFIPLLEHLGLIDRIDDWVRRQAMQHCRDLGLHTKEMFLDVNFSPVQTLDDDFAEALLTLTEETGFPVNRLVLEVTESRRMPFNEDNLKGLETLKSKGFNLSIDDFGSGYSSIENLIKIAATTIKTDKMIVENLETDVDRQFLIRALIEVAHHLNRYIIVEGVETPAQRRLLESFGADYMQGYLFSRPLTFEELAQKTSRFANA